MGLQIYELFFIYQQKTCFSALWGVDNSRLPPSRPPIQVRPARHAYLLVTIGPLVMPDLIRLLVMPDSISPLVMPDSIGHLPQPTTKQKVQPPYLRPTGRVCGDLLPDGQRVMSAHQNRKKSLILHTSLDAVDRKEEFYNAI